MKTVTIYTDGACSGNPGPGGWGAILRYGKVEKELSGSEPSTTNNRMELLGVISALEAAGFKPGDVKFIAMGSNMVLYDAMTDGWLSACSTQDPVAEGKLAVETLYAVLQGTATPGWTKLPTPVAYPETKDNFSWFE